MGGLSIHQNFTAVGAKQAIQDIHESRLTRAVLTDERVYLASPHAEINIVVGDYPRPGLVNMSHFNGKRAVSMGCYRGTLWCSCAHRCYTIRLLF
jgi:hypothetical protein